MCIGNLKTHGLKFALNEFFEMPLKKENIMTTTETFPHEYRIPVAQDYIRNIKHPYGDGISIIHALIKVKDFPNRALPDKVNPRSHEKINMKGRIPTAIEGTLRENPEIFHLCNRGCLIVAKKAWYDNQTRLLHFVIESDEQHGLVDGATTDRVIYNLKKEVATADFDKLKDEEIPDFFKKAYWHIEIVSGEIDDGLRLSLADARNTSEQVKEFSLEDLGNGYAWIKEVLENSEFKDKIRYRENEPKPVDIRVVLALLTMFHQNWGEKDPVVAYNAKGTVIDIYRDQDFREKYERLSPVMVDILRLYETIHAGFQDQYMKAYGPNAKLGRRTEVRYVEKIVRAKQLPLTGLKTQYIIPDGWLYPVLASFRVMLRFPKNGKGDVTWLVDPFQYFKDYGHELILDLIEQSEELGRNPNTTGRSKRLWSGLRMKVENRLLKMGILS